MPRSKWKSSRGATLCSADTVTFASWLNLLYERLRKTRLMWVPGGRTRARTFGAYLVGERLLLRQNAFVTFPKLDLLKYGGPRGRSSHSVLPGNDRLCAIAVGLFAPAQVLVRCWGEISQLPDSRYRDNQVETLLRHAARWDYLIAGCQDALLHN